MKNISPAELQLHCYVLSSGTQSLSKLIDQYSEHLLKYLSRSYKKHLTNNVHFVNEAVYTALEWYNEHPRQFNPSHGSLKKFLEMKADRKLQEIFEREHYEIHITGTDHLLALYLDNETDLMLAKLILRNDFDTVKLVSLLDLGSWRFSLLQAEVNRQLVRVRSILNEIPRFAPARKDASALVIDIHEGKTVSSGYRATGL